MPIWSKRLKKWSTKYKEREITNTILQCQIHKKKIHLLKANLASISTKPHVIAITETWLDNSVPDFELQGYEVYKKNRTSETSVKKEGGGVLIAVRKDLVLNEVTWCDEKLECVCVNLSVNNVIISICVCYFAKPHRHEYFLFFCEFINKIKLKWPSRKICVLGDFNLPGLRWNNSKGNICVEGRQSIIEERRIGNTLLEYLNLLHLSYAECPTNNNGNVLDLVFSDAGETRVSICEEPLLDVDRFHYPLNISLDLYIDIVKEDEPMSFDYKNANYEAIRAKINKINWSSKFKDCKNVNSMTEIFYAKMFEIIACCVKIKKRYFNAYPKWMSKELKDCVSTKIRMHAAYKAEACPTNKKKLQRNFEVLRKKSKKLQKRDYNRDVRNREQSITSDPSKFWNLINEGKQRHS